MNVQYKFSKIFLVIFLFPFFTPSANGADIFSLAQKICLEKGHTVGTDEYGSCIQQRLTEPRLKEPDQATVETMEKYMEENGGKFIGQAITATVIGAAVAVGTGAVVDGIKTGLRPAPAQSAGGGVQFGYPIKPYYGQSSPNVVNPPGQFFIPLK